MEADPAASGREEHNMELWTYEHTVTLLPALAVMAVIAIVLRRCLGKKPLQIRMIPFAVLACILVALEIGKQVLSLARGYDLYHLPLHFCSLFIFALPVMAFYRGKHMQTVSAITSAITAALFFLMLIYPALIYSSDNIANFFGDFFSFHTVAFHNIVMLEFLLILALNLHTPAPKGELKGIVWFVLAFCAVSATMAQVLQTNYANYYQCNVPVFEALRLSMQQSIGYVPTQLIYILIVSALNVVFVLLSYGLYRLAYRLIAGKKEKVCQ